MKGFLRKLELPEFVKDTRLTASLIIVLVLSLLGAIIGTLISPLWTCYGAVVHLNNYFCNIWNLCSSWEY